MDTWLTSLRADIELSVLTPLASAPRFALEMLEQQGSLLPFEDRFPEHTFKSPAQPGKT